MKLINVIKLYESDMSGTGFVTLYDGPLGSLNIVITERGFRHLCRGTDWTIPVRDFENKRKNSIPWIWKSKSGDNYQIWTTHNNPTLIIDEDGSKLTHTEMVNLCKVEPLTNYILPFVNTYETQ